MMARMTTGGPEAAPGRPRGLLSGLHVLVVDDDAGPRQLFRDVLELSGARVTVAPSARLALAAIQCEVPDVLVSDIMMPEHDGYWLIRSIRALSTEHGGRIPALAVTGDPSQHSRDRALAEGFNAHLQKPINVKDLSSIVARLASGV
jgi:CheY-like chemotaxis protein